MSDGATGTVVEAGPSEIQRPSETQRRAAPVFTIDSPWIRRAARRSARLRLVCVPYAGGGASVFRDLPDLLPPSIEVLTLQLPGREDRSGEDPPNDVHRLAKACAVALRPYLGTPFAFYGHCAGALLANEVAHEVGRRFGTWPTRLVAGAQPAPGLPVAGRRTLHQLPDDGLLDVVAERGGLVDALFRRPELVDMFLRLLRSDFTLWETYRYESLGLLPCPVTTVRGRDDDLVDAGQTAQWAKHTSGGWTELEVDGGHYFVTGLDATDAGALARVLLADGGSDEHRQQ